MSHHGREHVKSSGVPATDSVARASTHADNQNTDMTQVNKGISPGAGKHRGDQRDRSPTYTGTAKHSTRGNTPRKDVSTRAR